ncbi:MAG: YeeE/YedE thiosulfate transporter family protein [Nitrososphaerota archaeon]
MSALLIGIVSILLSYGNYATTGQGSIWGITTGESKIGGWFWKMLGIEIDKLQYYQQFKLMPIIDDTTQLIVIAILLGGASAALLTKSFSIKHIPGKWMLLQAVTGGFLLGYGARLALGCNIGNFFSAWSAGGIHAVTFTATLLVGVFIGLRITEGLLVKRVRPHRFSFSLKPKKQLALGIIVVIISLTISLFLRTTAAVWWLAGLAFGALGWIAGLCFATCYRDIVAPKYASGVMARAIGLAILTYATGIYILQLLQIPFRFGVPQIGQLQIAIGGLIFGLGIGIAGTCIFSSEWRAGGGSIYSIIVLLSTILIGMPALALNYEWWLTILPQEPKPFTLYSYGPSTGYIAPLTFSLIMIGYGIYIDISTRKTITTLMTKFTNRLTLKTNK